MRLLRNHWPALGLLLVLLFVAAVRVRLLSTPLERDEGEFAYAGQLMLHGVPPYKALYNMKMPGIYAAYAVVMAAFGQTDSAIHLGLLLVNLACIVLIFLLARKFMEPPGAMAACVAYALLSLSPNVLGFAAHATHFVVLAALGGMLLLLSAQEHGGLLRFFWSGALFGAAFLMKQHGGAFALFGLGVLLWLALRRRPSAWKCDAARIALFSAGVAAPILLTALIMWRVGVFERFWFWTVTYARVHAGNQSWSFGAANLHHYFAKLKWDGALWLLSALGLPSLWKVKIDADARFFIISLLAFSAAAVCPTLYFSEHYFVLMLPALALLAGIAVSAALEWTNSGKLKALHPAVWISFLACCAVVIYSHRACFFFLNPGEASAQTYFRNAFQDYPELGAYLRAHAPPDATLAVLGSEPELMFYSRLRSVTGYIYMYDLVQDHPFRAKMEQEMKDEVERGRPDYFVFVNLSFSWLTTDRDAAKSIFNWMRDYTDRFYEPYGVVSTASPHPIWGVDSFRQVPPSDRFIVLFRRK